MLFLLMLAARLLSSELRISEVAHVLGGSLGWLVVLVKHNEMTLRWSRLCRGLNLGVGLLGR